LHKIKKIKKSRNQIIVPCFGVDLGKGREGEGREGERRGGESFLKYISLSEHCQF